MLLRRNLVRWDASMRFLALLDSVEHSIFDARVLVLVFRDLLRNDRPPRSTRRAQSIALGSSEARFRDWASGVRRNAA